MINREIWIQIIKKYNSGTCSKCINTAFICFDLSMIIFCSVQAIIFISYPCVIWFYLYMILIFSSQALLHFLLIKISVMDTQKYKQTVIRSIFIIAIITFSYLFASIMYWGAKDIHPIYCALYQVFGLPFGIGILICLHCAACICALAQLIHAYISRRFYLLAIGGIEVQRARQAQLRQINNTMNIRQPDTFYNDYHTHPNNQSVDRSSIEKYYNFTDIIEETQKQQTQTTTEQNTNICSICLQSTKKTQKVKTPCNHIFHKICLEDWIATRGDSSKCPQCREKLRKKEHQSIQEVT